MTASGAVDVTGSGYRPAGDLRADGRPLSDAALSGEVEALLTAACLANDAALRQEGGAWTIQGDPTDAALLVAEAKIPGLSDRRTSRFKRVGELPFTSERKLMTTLAADGRAPGRVAAARALRPTAHCRGRTALMAASSGDAPTGSA